MSSDEFLVYARANREEWQAKSKEIVAEMMEELRTDEALGGIIPESEGPSEYDGGIQRHCVQAVVMLVWMNQS